MSRITAVFLAALAVFSCSAAEQKPLTVDVYYESLCPDSIYFITKELAPAYKQLKDFIKVNFVPFGKASWTPGTDGRPSQFICQHGPSECSGNRAQACALHEIEQNVKFEEQQQKMVDVVDCVMSSRNPASAVPQCAERHGLSDLVGRINSCSRSNLGDQLLIAHGEKTNAFQAPLTFVPTIVINGEKKAGAFRNFGNTVCNLIPEEKRPEICSQY